MHTHTSASSPATPPSPADADADADAILARASEMAHAADAGMMPPFLRGMNLGLLCEAEHTEDSRLFSHAAASLGARVTLIVNVASELGAASDENLMKIAHMFGCLYDGLECQGLPPAMVLQLRRTAGVPVFEGLSSPSHATAALAERLPGAAPTQAKRLLILQGALVFALLNHFPTRGSAWPQGT